MDKKLDAKYWNNRYHENNYPWDVGQITPPLKEYFDKLEDKEIKILIPGCGLGHEAHYLHTKGFKNVYVIDWAQKALDLFALRTKDFPKENLICGDFFKLDSQFELIIEQTFFCALPPTLRNDYVKKMNELLNDNGKLVGLLFNTQFPKNPPFGGSEKEYKRLFKEFFVINKLEESKNSISPRMGNELFFIFTKIG